MTMLSQGVNKVFLIGHVAQEPCVQKNTTVPNSLSFTLLTKEEILKNKLSHDHLEYHHIVLPPDLEITLKIEIGALLYIKGRLQTACWTDDLNIKRYKTEIVAHQLKQLFDIEMPSLDDELLAKFLVLQ